MTAVKRRTLARPAPCSGRGLFTGTPCTITFLPAQAGIFFVRTDASGHVPAHHHHLDAAPIHPAFAHVKPRSTNLALGNARVATVEHALSALAGLGVTDCAIEIDGPETPILDGSARPFAQAIQAAGLAELPGTCEPITLDAPITVEDGPASIRAEPRQEPGISIVYQLDYGPDAPLPPQCATWDGSPQAYLRSIAPARTFCTQAEATALQAAGLFKDLSPKDMLVIAKDGPIDNAYRMPGEPAAHKLLDAIGDFVLAGRPIQANITCTRSGHALNHDLARALAHAPHAS